MDWDSFVGPAVVAACIAGAVALFGALLSSSTIHRTSAAKLSADREALTARIETDLQLAVQKLSADREMAMSDKAWADYELRRDRYFEIAELIGCLFVGGELADKAKFHKVARTVRLVGSDEVVQSLNELTESIKMSRPAEITEQKFRAFFNAMRRDIRELHTRPPQGTMLGPSAFPIES